MLNLKNKLDSYKKNNLYREVKIFKENLLNFSSNDYLSIAKDKKVIQVFKQSANQYGFGSTSSPLICGYTKAHYELEKKFAEFLERDDAILFNSGFHANLGLFSVLSYDKIITDKYAHASIIDGIKLSGKKFYRYKHNDFNHLETILQKNNDNCLIITESIFSMEGDITPIQELLSVIKEQILFIDDAHGIGVLGEKGKGICEHYNLSQNDIKLLIVPLGKAFGSYGAIIAGEKLFIDALRQFSRTYSYSTALPPAIPSATIECLKIVESEHKRRDKLFESISYFINLAKQYELPLTSYDITPIKPILIGDIKKALFIQNYLLEKEIFISCIRPPTVPVNSSRLRISINYSHSKKQIHNIITSIAEIYHV